MEGTEAPAEKPRKKVAIIGTTPHRVKAPYGDLSWEIWAQAQPDLPRWNRWFEIHDLKVIQEKFAYVWTWMKSQDGSRPIYLREPHPEIKGSLAYPRQRMIDRFDTWHFTSTVAFELAMAIDEGFTDIAMFGIDMADETEYKEQKPGCRTMVTIAKMLGISVSVPPECELLVPSKLYALDDPDPSIARLKLKRQELEGRVRAAATGLEEGKNSVIAMNGAIQMIDHFINNEY